VELVDIQEHQDIVVLLVQVDIQELVGILVNQVQVDIQA
jgi:hypothetical protein